MRKALTTLATALLLLVPAAAASGGGATSSHAQLFGVVPHAGAPQAFGALSAASPDDVVYNGGPVMHTNTTYAIYWFPTGHTLDASYESTIDQYFADVAAASGRSDNVYSAATQYYDTAGSISYSSTFAGAYVDTDPFPASGCTATAVCLTDEQLQAEIQTALTHQGWHGGLSNIFFVITPEGVSSCSDASNSACSTNVFCAYHSDFVDASGEDVIYANEPFEGATSGGCTDTVHGQGFPNNPDADTTINTISHEQNESISDPLGNAWLNASGEEMADICEPATGWQFGPPLGTTNGQPYNQVINAHDYSVQEEYSNDDDGCVQHYTPTVAPATVAQPIVSGAAGEGRVLATTQGSWMHAPSGYAYQWQRCGPTGTGCVNISAATVATYQLTSADAGHTVRAEVQATNAAGTSAFTGSAPTAVVAPIPAAAARPVLSGIAAVGKRLSTTPGTWNGSASFTYQWLRCDPDGTGCSTISGATSSKYVAARADVGHTLQARITAKNAAGTIAILSKRSGVIIAVPAAKEAPLISGQARVGLRLAARRGSWSGPPKTYHYQWLRCNVHGRSCVRIHGAVHPARRLGQPDAGHRLRVRISAVDAAGTATAISAPTARVP